MLVVNYHNDGQEIKNWVVNNPSDPKTTHWSRRLFNTEHFFKPGLKVYAGEPEGAADAVLSIQSGKVEKAPFVNTIADGLMTTLSERTLEIIKAHVADIILVSEDEIKAALRLVYERMKIIIEPSCAVPLAAVLKNTDLFKGKKVGIILTGGNVDLSKFKDWF